MKELLEALLQEIELRESLEHKVAITDRKTDRSQHTTSALFTSGKGERCVFCLGDHQSEHCSKIRKPKERKDILRKFARCYKCLVKGHRASDCKQTIVCVNCKGEHHSALCNKAKGVEEAHGGRNDSNAPSNNDTSRPGAQKVASPGNYYVGAGGKVALQTAQARVGIARVRVLFDSGSHKSFITTKVAETAGLTSVRREWLNVCTFGGGTGKSGLRDVVRVNVVALDNSASITIEAYVVPEISRVHNEHLEDAKKEFAHLRDLWLSDVCRSSAELEIEMLVGADYLWQFQTGSTIRGEPEEPVAIETVLGWVLSGPMKRSSDLRESETRVQANLIVRNGTSSDPLEDELRKLWDLETLGIREEDGVQEEFLDNITFNGTRYSVKLPWKIAHKTLPTNYANSIGRLKSTIRRLRREPNVLQEYEAVIKEQLKAGIIETVTELEERSKVHYLPHQAVVRRNAETTKVRVVYDARQMCDEIPDTGIVGWTAPSGTSLGERQAPCVWTEAYCGMGEDFVYGYIPLDNLWSWGGEYLGKHSCRGVIGGLSCNILTSSVYSETPDTGV